LPYFEWRAGNETEADRSQNRQESRLLPWKSGRLSPFLQILIPSVQIDEIIKNGGISDRERLEDNPRARTIAAFADVYGVGPLKANELWNDGARR
jgi:hypothetical protein